MTNTDTNNQSSINSNDKHKDTSIQGNQNAIERIPSDKRQPKPLSKEQVDQLANLFAFPKASDLRHQVSVKDSLWQVMSNPSGLLTLPSIPCAQRSLYFGLFTGTFIGLFQVVRTGQSRFWRHGFWVFIGTSLFSWFYCRHDFLQRQIDTYLGIELVREQQAIQASMATSSNDTMQDVSNNL